MAISDVDLLKVQELKTDLYCIWEQLDELARKYEKSNPRDPDTQGLVVCANVLDSLDSRMGQLFT
jgi:hypothetical protein